MKKIVALLLALLLCAMLPVAALAETEEVQIMFEDISAGEEAPVVYDEAEEPAPIEEGEISAEEDIPLLYEEADSGMRTGVLIAIIVVVVVAVVVAVVIVLRKKK